ncbi:MAG: hypothetical protein GYA17_22400 [Chloroflexi bacterium]|nr:hypothetical protein [Chloroflexota bacterium]
MRRGFSLLLCLVLSWLTAGCFEVSSTEDIDMTPPEPSATLSPTATIDWFPASATPTRAPTHTMAPTPDQRPGVTGQILADDFTHLETWQTLNSQVGNVTFGREELTIAVAQPKGQLFSLRNAPVLTDYYLEITATASLCRSGDVYGLLLHANSDRDFYRFLIGCNGQLRLERVKNAEVVLLHDWTVSGQVPPGSPLVSRIGVWAYNQEMRFFINGVFQFSAVDPVFRSGTLGIFARSGGQTALSVSFSALDIYRLDADAIPPTPTVTPTPTRTIPGVTLPPTRATPVPGG